MGRARAAIEVAGSVEDAEALWYDLQRWPTFIDGFARVVRSEGWPAAGGTLVWDSTPAGRGRVGERVTAQGAGEGETAGVEDPRLSGTPTGAFTAAGNGGGGAPAPDHKPKQGGT